MTDLTDKEKTHGHKFAHDHEVEFKVHAKRDKLLGAWVAEKLGLGADKKEEYVKSLIAADFDKRHDDVVVARVKADFDAAGIHVSEHDIKERLHHCYKEARKHIFG